MAISRTRLLGTAIATAALASTGATPRCEFPQPVAAPAPPPAARPCHALPTADRDAVTAAVVAGFEPTRDGGQAVVAYPCDNLGERIAEIVVETGGGHGGSLSMWRARRAADGRFAVIGIAYRGDSITRRAATPPYELVTGVVDVPDLERVRAGVDADITEQFPAPPPNSIGGFSMTWSSNDFHVLIRLVDDDGRAIERRFTGYAGTLYQSEFLGLQAAEPALSPITSLASGGSGAAGSATADAVALFADRFVAAVPWFDSSGDWWVKERFVDLARFLGSPPVIPGLLTRLHVTKPRDRSQVDTRAGAVAAIAAITGWDARRDTATVEAAAARDLATCRQR
jgi:hypothetical protein